MIDNFLLGIQMFGHFKNFVAIFAGVGVGIITGAIPGMTGTMGVALALPFTFYMDPITGILFLVGLYKGAIYGGSITAILIKTPGTPAAACTVLDGYPMAQQGKAGKALNMALYASVFADFVSNMSLIIFAAPIAAFALRFGPPEFFTLISFSLTIIAGVSGKSITKGLIAGGMGLMAATIGMDLVYGSSRFSFGSVELLGGLNFIPVLIGLFAIPELIKEYGETYTSSFRTSSMGDRSISFRELKRCFKSIVRGSLIGVVIGAIPGIGGAPSAFLSYNEAKRNSKHPETFGQGEIEGVAASEAGNNGVCGATMIPLLTLGVPGDVITAILLGAFMVHDLRPGPLLFQKNIDIIYGIFVGIMLSSVAMLLLGKLGIRLFARIANVPNSILFPAVLVLCVYGTYAVDNKMFDVLVMIIMGLVGYFMLLFELPPAPFLIAFILGPMFEDNLRRSLLLSHGDPSILFRSFICWIFWGLTLLSIILIVRRNLKAKTLQTRDR
ncbi:MAG: tripartite tricarboxylate transporter permease [Deltaproteobacteria bacterium]|nr:tripartite tricarboxylate transporter permease [Deltaproteobacteria bacterium]MBW2307099.1 tripartite tricarboxylate transporter permease [Deltaproteobacteria bacterium]